MIEWLFTGNFNMFKSLFFTTFLFIAYLLGAEERSIVIFQTSDIHGNYQNWLKLASIIKEEKKKNNVLLIDCGDTFQGNPVNIVEKGDIAAKIMNFLGYDVWVPGNHEFDFGSNNILRLSLFLKADTLMANVAFNPSAPSVKTWKLYQKNSLRIAVIGMTFPYLKNSIWDNERGSFDVEGVNKALDRVIPEIMDAHPDMIVLAVHNGLDIAGPDGETLWKTAWKFPQINLILGAHSHREIPGVNSGPGSWFAQDGRWAEKLLKVTVTKDMQTGKISMESLLLTPASAIPDKELEAFLKSDFDAAGKKLSQKVGETSATLLPPGEKEFDSTMTELVSSAIAEASGAEIVFYSTAGRTFSIVPGPVTFKDICCIEPYENTIGVLELSPSELKEIIKEQFEQKKFKRFLYPWEICAKVDRKGNLLAPLSIPGKGEWTDDSIRIKAAFTNYDIAGAGNKFPVLKKTASSELSKPFDTGILVRDAIMRYISKHSPLDMRKRKYIEVSNEQKYSAPAARNGAEISR